MLAVGILWRIEDCIQRKLNMHCYWMSIPRQQ